MNSFGLLYLGSTLKVCFGGAVLRDRGDGRPADLRLDERDLVVRQYAEADVRAPLSVIDLHGDEPLRVGVPSDILRESKQSLARRWSLAFHEHFAQTDGISYPSHLNGETNLAIYDRAVERLNARSTIPLQRRPELGRRLSDLKVSL